MTKDDVKHMAKSAEQKFAESIKKRELSEWEKGRRFIAMSDRTLYIFEPTGLDNDLSEQSFKGKQLVYQGIESSQTPDLKEECVIVFTDGSTTYRYKTGKSTSTAMKEIDSSKLPLISDIEFTAQWKEKIEGKTLWTKSNLWYDANGDRMQGLKFAKVTVDDVEAYAGDFPMRVKIKGPDGTTAWIYMNYTSDPHDTRDFASTFFLTDPKGKYPQISEANWSLIQQGRLAEGMTKEECKLSIGNPDEVRSGHDRSQTIDIWQYSDGTYMFFTDGLLTEFRQ